MTCYVDDVRHPFGRMICCHLWADTLPELHAMAQAVGVARRWFQTPPKASWDHYDVSLSCKADAMRRGAVLTDMFGPLYFLAWARDDYAAVVKIHNSRELRGLPLDGILRGQRAGQDHLATETRPPLRGPSRNA